ncbi:hypothetical protein CEXT_433831 [Caerostris extrusa]|uniref:Uncharacterized protein n=1 Tax=Caerostris extrusa TaxID=172846 RepID=A0AAV4TMP7_CAEEX|nr:hypothetical protein CEXT_433831 [Caerostris extrusa]
MRKLESIIDFKLVIVAPLATNICNCSAGKSFKSTDGVWGQWQEDLMANLCEESMIKHFCGTFPSFLVYDKQMGDPLSLLSSVIGVLFIQYLSTTWCLTVYEE